MSLWNGKMICVTKHLLPTEQIAQLYSCSLSKSEIIALSPQFYHQRLPPCKRVSWKVFHLLCGAARPTLHFFRQKAWKNRNTQAATSCLNTACISVWGEEIVTEIGQSVVSSLGFVLVRCSPPTLLKQSGNSGPEPKMMRSTTSFCHWTFVVTAAMAGAFGS